MKYEVLIYAGNETLVALDVDGDKKQYISMAGNNDHSADDVNGFYEHLLDYYNVDDLSELNSGVRIINGGTSKKNIDFFNKKFINVDDFSLWRVEELLPIIMIQKSMIERNESVKVRVYDNCYEVTADSSFNISVNAITESEKELTLEDFIVMNNFNGAAFHSNSDEVKLLRAELYETRNIINELKNKVREFEKVNYELDKNVRILMHYQAGQIIEFGIYDGKPIKWIILKNDNNTSIYVVSEEILCERVFANRDSNNWKESDLRTWLNGEFYADTFNKSEKAGIIKTDDDNITLLTDDEAETLLTKEISLGSLSWWLRCPRKTEVGIKSTAPPRAYYERDSKLPLPSHSSDSITPYSRGVRPALYLSLNSIELK